MSDWISVDDRLPESGVRVLAYCRTKYSDGYICEAFYAAPGKLVAGYSDKYVTDYDEDDDEYYFLQGWYEIIKAWNDYDSIGSGNYVTHWMPLPDPPKEE